MSDVINEQIKRDENGNLIVTVSSNFKKRFYTYCRFKDLHDIEIQRLKHLKNNGIKLISSMGI